MYRVTMVVWHSIQGRCNNHTGPKSRVCPKPPLSPCISITFVRKELFALQGILFQRFLFRNCWLSRIVESACFCPASASLSGFDETWPLSARIQKSRSPLSSPPFPYELLRRDRARDNLSIVAKIASSSLLPIFCVDGHGRARYNICARPREMRLIRACVRAKVYMITTGRPMSSWTVRCGSKYD